MPNTRKTEKLSLEALLEQVAIAWEMHRDYEIVQELTDAYELEEAYEEELYDFLDKLVEAELIGPPPEHEVRQIKHAVRERLKEQGVELPDKQKEAEESNDPPPLSALANDTLIIEEATSFLDYAVLASGKTPSEIEELLGVDASFLDDINTYPNIVPLFVREDIIESAVAKLGLDEDRARYMLLEVDPRCGMAASRSEAFDDETPTFEEVVDRSLMTDEQKAYWKGLARQNP